jgi:hypothetical protein
MTVLSGKDGSTTGGANGVGAGEVVKPHAFLGQSVDGGSLCEILQVGSVSRDCLEGVVVDEYNYHVGLGASSVKGNHPDRKYRKERFQLFTYLRG